MDPLIVLLIVVTTVLTVMLVIVGVQVILILNQFRQTLQHVNKTLNTADSLLQAVSHPFNGMGDIVAGVKTGLKLADTFGAWLKEHKGHDEK